MDSLAQRGSADLRDRIPREAEFLKTLVLALLCLAVATSARADVDQYLGRPITAVQLIIDGKPTVDPSLLAVVETKVGRPLSMVEVRETITHLFSLGRFDNVSVDATVAGEGVALRYDLSPIHTVSSIEFEGMLSGAGIDVGQLRRAVTDRYGTSPPLGRVDELAQVITDLLSERGYRHAEVKPRADISHETETAKLVFTIQPGMRTLVGMVDIVGMPTVARDELLKQLEVTPGSPYQPGRLATNIARYVETRRKAGYFEAQVTPAVRFSDNDTVANLTLTVSPGAHVRLEFAGDPLPQDRRAEFVPVEAEGSIDEDLLEDSTNRIEDYLRRQGYQDAKAPHTRTQHNGDVVITFTVKRGPQYRVSNVALEGNMSVSVTDLQPVIQTREGSPFSQAAMDADRVAIERLYRGRGFAAVRVQADSRPNRAALAGGLVPVEVTFAISEGVRTLVGTVQIIGNTSIDDATIRSRLGLKMGAPYFDTQLRSDADAIQLLYANQGYRSATVESDPGFSADRSQANPVFTIREGPRVFVDHILISGNVRTRASVIERELQLHPGDPLSLAAVEESQRRLAALQLFRRAPQITELRHGDETKRDLLVTVEEASATTLDEGGGLEGRLRVVPNAENVAVNKFEIAPRAFIGYTRRNLFGKNRSINLFASGSAYPPDISTASAIGYGVPEYRLLATFHEPRLFGTTMDGLLSAVSEQQIRSGYNIANEAVTAQVAKKVSRYVSISGAYQLQHTRLFDVTLSAEDLPLIDQVFTTVRLSSFSANGFYDTRDDQVDPTTGVFVSATAQLAAQALGSEVGFVKSFFTGEIVRRVPHARNVIFVGVARLGLATGFPRSLVGIGPDGQPIVQETRDLPEAVRFFAGGDTTVRGFALDTLGTPATIVNGFPIGGNAMSIFNAEFRVPVRGGLGVVGFVDTGNVFQTVGDLNLTELRTAVGTGLRYKSPVGPLRIDVGFKVRPQPGEGLTAWFVSFGQAF